MASYGLLCGLICINIEKRAWLHLMTKIGAEQRISIGSRIPCCFSNYKNSESFQRIYRMLEPVLWWSWTGDMKILPV